MSLTYIAQQFTIYTGSVLLVVGIVGNGMNIFIFSSVRAYRTTPCSFYFLIGSIFNCLYILINLPVRIFSAIYAVDSTLNSLIWCWIQSFLIGVLGLTSFTCSCLATIDQFFVTSRSVYFRRLSNIKWAHRIVSIVIIIWCLHGIPVFLFYNIPPITKRCRSNNAVYSAYILFYLLGLLCAIPILVMILFGCLAYRNVRLTRALAAQQTDRQLTRMTLIQVALVVISIGPFGINSAYSLITGGITKDVNRQLKEAFALTIFTLISYFYYVGSFYMFLTISSRFRRTVKDRILWWRRGNQVIPFQQPSLTRRTML